MQSEVSALEVRGLTKRFDRPAVDALDLTIRSGEFYALLGPNGAGKRNREVCKFCCKI